MEPDLKTKATRPPVCAHPYQGILDHGPESSVESEGLDPRLRTYWPSERQAILEYRLHLCEQLQREAGLAESIESWENGAAIRWRQEKMRLDGRKQLREIERHKYLTSKELGYDMGWEAAALDWIEKYAASWRDWWERQAEARPHLKPAAE